jgi:hypothetical protein
MRVATYTGHRYSTPVTNASYSLRQHARIAVISFHPTTFLGAGRMNEGPRQEAEKPAPGSPLPDQKPVSPKQVVIAGVWATFSALMGLLGTLPNLKSYADSQAHGQWLSWVLLAFGLAFLVEASVLIYRLRSMLSRIGPERSWQFFAKIPVVAILVIGLTGATFAALDISGIPFRSTPHAAPSATAKLMHRRRQPQTAPRSRTPTAFNTVRASGPESSHPVSPTLPSSSSPTGTAGISSDTPVSINVECILSTRSPRPGMTITMTYKLFLNRADKVGLGAAIYDNSGNDDSTGTGDIDSIQLPQGQVSESRPVPIPGDLSPGNYEIDAEIWPANEVGQDGANTIADPTCAYFSVP